MLICFKECNYSPISAFSFFLPVGQLEWHESFKAPLAPYHLTPSHRQDKPLPASKLTSISNYWNTNWPKGTFCNLCSAHLGYRIRLSEDSQNLTDSASFLCRQYRKSHRDSDVEAPPPRPPMRSCPWAPLGAIGGMVHTSVAQWHLLNSKYISNPWPQSSIHAFVNRGLKIRHFKRESVFFKFPPLSC